MWKNIVLQRLFKGQLQKFITTDKLVDHVTDALDILSVLAFGGKNGERRGRSTVVEKGATRCQKAAGDNDFKECLAIFAVI